MPSLYWIVHDIGGVMRSGVNVAQRTQSMSLGESLARSRQVRAAGTIMSEVPPPRRMRRSLMPVRSRIQSSLTPRWAKASLRTTSGGTQCAMAVMVALIVAQSGQLFAVQLVAKRSQRTVLLAQCQDISGPGRVIA